ncbi:cadherin-15 isoform X1 [Triplophysa rosa]|uniref:Cadherin-15 n=1 Tax=Triplophysa rosa TaxID=992332 RepID=A0A9W7X510_TRIRA|nr:cadherin-15 isoform X1 [Triplophysa rosa]KAI7813849.1 putative cadherin-15 [Triplophysa rosa]
MMKAVVLLGVLMAVLCQVCGSKQVKQRDLNPAALYPWLHRSAGTQVRVKRDWIIPPIRVLENSKQVPEDLVQIKSDKIFTGEVIYMLEGPGVDQDPKGLFEIDDKTGWIKSQMPLDREKHRSFKLKAFALSPSGERLESPTTIEIYVLDQNDNRPVFTQNEFIGTIPEFSVPGTSVMQVSAVDADDPTTDNAALSYSVIGQETVPPNSINKTMFGINNKTGVIYIRDVGLDRDVVQSIKLTLQVADMSGMGLTSIGRAIITISDINNHAPKFQPDQYKMYALENKHIAEVGRINATDKDQRGGVNWKMIYKISSGDPAGHFSVRTDPVTNQGIISVVKPLDFESQVEHRLTVTAENAVNVKGPYERVQSATVTVTVVNENEAPVFYKNPIKVSVAESAVPSTVLVSDIAHDPDNAKLRYEIIEDPENWLFIDHATGQISVRRTFNIRSPHVKNNIYSAVVKVIDQDADGVFTTATLEVTLWETNDYAPVLIPSSGTVCSDRDRDKLGLLLSAVDQDMSPQSDPFTFYIVDQSVAVNWTIITLNETHAVLQPLIDIESGEFSVPVVVSDSGSPPLSSSSLVNVTVCPCDSFGDCKSFTAAMFGTRMGISFIALMLIMGSVALLLLLLVLAVAVRGCRRQNVKRDGGLLVGASDEDIRDNVFHYDEQGGGEEDEDAFNIDFLRNPSDGIPPPVGFFPQNRSLPRGKQPLRKDAPHNLPSPTYPRKLAGEPTDIEDFINVGLDAADADPNVPPYDTALIYDFEGDGSVAGSLSSIASMSSDGDQDYDYLNDWGPRFKKLANMYDPR